MSERSSSSAAGDYVPPVITFIFYDAKPHNPRCSIFVGYESQCHNTAGYGVLEYQATRGYHLMAYCPQHWEDHQRREQRHDKHA